MFWQKKKVPVQAKILADEGYGWKMASGTVLLHRQMYIIEVYPPDEPPFRCETKVWVSWPNYPAVGVTVNAVYAPGTKKAEIVIAGDPRYDWNIRRAEKEASAKAERERLLSGRPGTP